MKNLLNLVAICSLLLIIGLGCGDSKSTTESKPVATKDTTKEPAKTEKPISISAKDLVKSYKENEVAADGKFRDKTLAVTGKVSNIAETFGKYSVHLEGTDIVVSVLCSFDDAEKDSIAKLKKDQTTTLIGKVSGMTAGLYVGLDECKVQ